MPFTSSTLPATPSDLQQLSQPNSGYLAAEPRKMPPVTLDNLTTFRTMMVNGITASRPLPPSTITQSTLDIPSRDHGRTIHVLTYGPSDTAADAAQPALPVILLFHGGGNVLGHPAMGEASAQAIAAKYRAVVVSASQRFAPEHPYPAAVHDAWDVLVFLSSASTAQHIHANTNPGAGLVVGGSSAGARLALGLAYVSQHPAAIPEYRAIHMGILPEAAITGLLLGVPGAMNPDVVPEDLKPWYLSRTQNATADGFGTGDVDFLRSCYKGDNSPVACPLSYLPEHLRGDLPRTVVLVCGWDPLRDDGLILARCIRERNKGEEGCRVKVYQGLPHAFWMRTPDFQEAREYSNDVVEAAGWLLERSK